MTTRLLINSENCAAIRDSVGATFTLSADDSHYLTRVLRFSEGATLIIVNPESGAELSVKVIEAGKIVTVEVLKAALNTPPDSPIAALLYPLTKGSTTELVLEKGCELGVRQFILWQGERSIVRLGDRKEQNKKIERWQKILRAAAQQSGKRSVPAITLFETLESALASLPASWQPTDRPIVCSLDEDADPIGNCASIGADHYLVSGPEGDFSPDEMRILGQRAFRKGSLGPYRLRAETAAIAAISMVSAIAGFSTPRDAR